MKIASIVGARPQFIKVSPIVRETQEQNISNHLKLTHLLIHTGQHYDYEMNKIFFEELGIPEPDYNLEVGSGPHGMQTAEMLKRVEKVLLKEKPTWVLVYGDTNSTLAGALAAAKLHIPIAHIEAGLRSHNKRMPEEINRILTDHCSDVLFCPTVTAVRNLENEGFTNILNDGKLLKITSLQSEGSPNKLPIVINVGDIMYDSLLMSLEIAENKSSILKKLELKPKEYYLTTIHRAENTEDNDRLKSIMEALIEISKEKPVILPIHPRTRKILDATYISSGPSIKLHLIDPVCYFDMLILEKNAKKILTDSGGIQKEAYLLKVTCITLRNETEWIETVETGWNALAGAEKNKIIESTLKPFPDKNYCSPELYGDGKTAEKIIRLLKEKL